MITGIKKKPREINFYEKQKKMKNSWNHLLLVFPTTSENLAAGGIIVPEPNLKSENIWNNEN